MKTILFSLLALTVLNVAPAFADEDSADEAAESSLAPAFDPANGKYDKLCQTADQSRTLWVPEGFGNGEKNVAMQMGSEQKHRSAHATAEAKGNGHFSVRVDDGQAEDMFCFTP